MSSKNRNLIELIASRIRQVKALPNYLSMRRVLLMKLAVSFVILLYTVSAIAYVAPASALRDAIVHSESAWWQFFGLEQRWALFAPNIRVVNYDVVCLVTYTDGSMSIWQPPRVELMNLLERYRKDKFRKWGVDTLPGSRYKECWPDFARYVGRLHTVKNGAQPESVSLVMYSGNVPKPEEHVSVMDMPEHTDYHSIFYYHLKPEDLK